MPEIDIDLALNIARANESIQGLENADIALLARALLSLHAEVEKLRVESRQHEENAATLQGCFDVLTKDYEKLRGERDALFEEICRRVDDETENYLRENRGDIMFKIVQRATEKE